MTVSSVTIIILAVALLGGGAAGITGCVKKGPAERAGEKVDRAVEDLKDSIDPPGPAEKAGRAVDRAVEDATD